MIRNEKREPDERHYNSPNTSKYPWYVYLVGGYSLTGLFSWYLTAQQLWIRNRRLPAAYVLGINMVIFAMLFWGATEAKIAWWCFDSSFLVFNCVWSLSAWGVQRWCYGRCERRLMIHQWREWITPMAIAITIGSSIAVAINILPAVSERFAAVYSQGANARSLVLWEFFHNLPVGAAAGALLGLWWAGERRFETSHINAFLFGIGLLAVIQVPFYALFVYLVHGSLLGLEMLDGETWEMVPYAAGGWRHFLIIVDKFDFIGLIVVGLLFGAPHKIRFFLKRSAVVIPMVIFLTLPLNFFTQEGWQLIQGQIVYQLSSPEQSHRDAAFDWLKVMLKRFPNHANWPYLALRFADYQYEKGEFGASQLTYQEIVDRFGDTNEWKTIADKSRAIVSSPKFGQQHHAKSLLIPMVSYQPHLTQNWMALLSNLRFLNGAQVPESDITIRLMEISNSEQRIDLPDLSGLADLDDTARSLGYEVAFMPSDPDTAKRLIENDIAVLLPVFRTFYLLYGFDDATRTVKAYCFSQLTSRLKHRATDNATEILMRGANRMSETLISNRRIANEARCQWPLDQWEEKAFSDAAPFMAVVHRPDQQSRVDKLLGNTPDFNKTRSQGYLAALIGLSSVKHADPMACLQWAQKGAQMIGGSFPLQVAHLGQSLWDTRARKIGVKIEIEKKFQVLEESVAFFSDPSTVAFAEKARQSFSRDFKAGKVPWNIREMLVSLLDQSDPEQRARIIELVEYGLARHPSSKKQWLRLAGLYELEGDLDAMSQALEGACSAATWDAKTQLSLAALYTKTGRNKRVKELIKNIDPQKIANEPDYPYCLGALAEADGNVKAALRHYAEAIDMCRYRPDYHLRYAKLLLDQGNAEAAEKALVWTTRIDSGDEFRREALKLLSRIR